jgi:aldehyde dehydrogenase (NAD+)
MWQGKNFIKGEFQEWDGETFDNINPSEEESLGKFPITTAEVVKEACDTAREAFEIWRHTSRLRRGETLLRVAEILEERKEEVATVISLETGKNYNESIAEVNEALHMAQYAFSSARQPIGEILSSEIPFKEGAMIRKPKGVIAIISPFNFPLAVGAFWCAAPAIVEGNVVVLKPSEDAPMTSQLCAEIYEEAGLPPGIFNVVHGDGTTGDALARANVDHICFTGSAAVGQHIRKICAASWHKTSSCELGSKSAVMVFDDAKIDLAVDACVASAFKLSGQRCVSAGRLIVQQKIFNKFVERFLSEVHSVKTGPPLVDGFVMGEGSAPSGGADTPSRNYYGPLINKAGMDKVISYNKMVADSSQTKVLIEGERVKRKGYFLTPTVYTTHWEDEPFLKNEVFGPHVAIIPFDDVQTAVNIYNDTDYGLSLGVITEDYRVAKYCRDNCDFGLGYWNGGSIAAESHLGFGGVKKSGNGMPSAARTFRSVTHEVAWTTNYGESLAFPQGMNK